MRTAKPASNPPITRDNDWGPEPKGKTPLLAQLGRPLVWVARGLAWLTEPEESRGRGKIQITGKALIFSAGMVYCFALTTESVLLLLNRGTRNIYGSDRVAEQIRFVPKLGVADGAQLGRLVPSPLKLARITSNFAFGWVPGYRAFGGTSFDDYLVWADPNFYVALVGAALTSILQAKAIRQVSLKVRRARLDQVRSHRVEDLSPKALTIAKIRAAEYQHAQVGGYAFDGLVILASYGFEISCFVLGFSLGDSSFAFLIINGVIQVFGFESCYRLSGLADDEEVINA